MRTAAQRALFKQNFARAVQAAGLARHRFQPRENINAGDTTMVCKQQFESQFTICPRQFTVTDGVCNSCTSCGWTRCESPTRAQTFLPNHSRSTSLSFSFNNPRNRLDPRQRTRTRWHGGYQRPDPSALNVIRRPGTMSLIPLASGWSWVGSLTKPHTQQPALMSYRLGLRHQHTPLKGCESNSAMLLRFCHQ